MKDYKTLTREKVDVEPGAARYMGETHMMEDWSDKMIDLVLNGPTLNGFKKDELRAILRQTYAALKQYEQIGPMASPYMNDPSAIVARAFAELYPGIDYHAQFVPDLCDESGNRAFGLTIFPDDGSAPIVCISAEAPISAAPELLAHELAHVATPEDKDHGEAWQTAEKAIGDKYYPFKVYEPKERLVLAIDFEGKVVQHSLCDNVLEPVFSRRFIRDNYAGQIGKGTHDGLDRLAGAMRHYFFSRKAADEEARRAAGLPYRPMEEWDYAEGWVLKGDFSKFFYTLLHAVCFEKARKALAFLSDEELIDFVEWLLWIVIDSTPDPGIPIGNQSSQLLALLYLDDFDHWLRDDLGLVYGRYMDDFYIISSDKLLLREILKRIEEYIKPLGLRLNGKTQIFPLKNGIDFLGFHTYLTSTGKVVRKVRAKSIDNMKRKIRKFRGLVDRGKMTLESVSQSYASWTGHISHGNTYHLRQNMDAYFFAYFPELKPTERRQDSCLKPSEALPTRQKSSSAASTARRSSGSRQTKTTLATLPTAPPS